VIGAKAIGYLCTLSDIISQHNSTTVQGDEEGGGGRL
jgi:hypothetical protein